MVKHLLRERDDLEPRTLDPRWNLRDGMPEGDDRPTPFRKQWKHGGRPLLEREDGACDHHLVTVIHVVHLRSPHLHIGEAQYLDSAFHEFDTSLGHIHEEEGKLWEGDGKREPGQAGAGADVEHGRCGVREQGGVRKAVADVTVRQTLNLVWSNTAGCSRLGRQPGPQVRHLVPLGGGEVEMQQLEQRRKLMFHVKHRRAASKGECGHEERACFT